MECISIWYQVISWRSSSPTRLSFKHSPQVHSWGQANFSDFLLIFFLAGAVLFQAWLRLFLRIVKGTTDSCTPHICSEIFPYLLPLFWETHNTGSLLSLSSASWTHFPCAVSSNPPQLSCMCTSKAHRWPQVPLDCCQSVFLDLNCSWHSGTCFFCLSSKQTHRSFSITRWWNKDSWTFNLWWWGFIQN